MSIDRQSSSLGSEIQYASLLWCSTCQQSCPLLRDNWHFIRDDSYHNIRSLILSGICVDNSVDKTCTSSSSYNQHCSLFTADCHQTYQVQARHFDVSIRRCLEQIYGIDDKALFFEHHIGLVDEILLNNESSR